MGAELFCGVDIGASATKLLLLDSAQEVLSRVVEPSGVDYAATADGCLDRALSEAGADRGLLRHTVSTGYGRRNASFADTHKTEIHCHGAGCYHELSQAMTIVDIGGQDNKVIVLDTQGRKLRFKMNRKCAAGTGAFIEEIAVRLGLDVSEMDALAASTPEAVRLSSFCTVFAKTEILAHLRQGRPAAGIVRGAFLSVVHRVVEMDPLDGTVVLTGGVVAHNPTIARVLEDELGRPVTVPTHPQHTGALGAALLAHREWTDSEPDGLGRNT